ncbi:MAG: hypothetical protein HUJ54_15515, partial [Erysipelotrichaceae bacterium]|nr:hypothetical protein [Erysipelotrichaceae bacterium]
MPHQNPNELKRPVWFKSFQIFMVILMVLLDGILIGKAFQNRMYLSTYFMDPHQEIDHFEVSFRDPDLLKES